MLFNMFINNHGDETKCDLWARNTMMILRTIQMENSWSCSRKKAIFCILSIRTPNNNAKQVAEFQLCQKLLGSNNELIKIKFIGRSVIYWENYTWPTKGIFFFPLSDNKVTTGTLCHSGLPLPVSEGWGENWGSLKNGTYPRTCIWRRWTYLVWQRQG